MASSYLQTNKSPTALTVVILMHGAALGALALSKMEVVKEQFGRTKVIYVDPIKPPPETKPEPVKQQPQQRETVTITPPVIKMEPRPTEFDVIKDPLPPKPDVLPGPVDLVLPPAPPPPPPPPPQVHRVEPARAKANLASYVSDADYPAAALRSEEQGATRFRLEVGPDGRVRDCTVTGSSGSSSLDTATCRLMKNRARFTPARDSTGNTTGDTISSTIRWVLPE